MGNAVDPPPTRHTKASEKPTHNPAARVSKSTHGRQQRQATGKRIPVHHAVPHKRMFGYRAPGIIHGHVSLQTIQVDTTHHTSRRREPVQHAARFHRNQEPQASKNPTQTTQRTCTVGCRTTSFITPYFSSSSLSNLAPLAAVKASRRILRASIPATSDTSDESTSTRNAEASSSATVSLASTALERNS